MSARHAPARRALAAALAALLGPALGGCSIGPRDDDPNVAYSVAEQRALLEVPPNIEGELRKSLLRIPDDGKGPISRSVLLPEPQSVRLVRDGRVRWLELHADPRELWGALKEFWRTQGFVVERDEPLLGILETGWREQPAAGGGAPRDSDAAGWRVKYRLRLERLEGEQGVRLFLSQRRQEPNPRGGREGSEYLRRPPDSEQETEMLQRLLVRLGVGEQLAQGILSARDVERLSERAYLQEVDGRPTVVVADSFARVWRRVGAAIEAIGLEIESTLASQGVYEVLFDGELPEPLRSAQPQPEGFFARVFGSSAVEHTYQIYVEEEPGSTRISIADAAGTSAYPQLEQEIMRRLQEQLR